MWTGASCCLEAPPRTPSCSWSPARVTRPSGHPCSDPFVAPGPHAALSAAALPPQGCSVGPPPWPSPQTLEAPSLRGPHSCCAVSSRWASTSPPAAPTSPSSPPPGMFRPAPTPAPAPICCHCPLLPPAPPHQSQVRMPGFTAHPSPLGASATKPCVSCTPDTSGVRCTPSLVQAAIPDPRSRPPELSPDTARRSRPLPTAAH